MKFDTCRKNEIGNSLIRISDSFFFSTLELDVFTLSYPLKRK